VVDPPQAGPYWNGGFDRDAGTVSENEMFDFAFHLPRRASLHRKINKWVVKPPPRSSCRRI
ncbi:MAG: hypothetical protein WBE50_02405, partial [Methyloceanibacter sp.]